MSLHCVAASIPRPGVVTCPGSSMPTIPCSTTGLSPFEASLGYQPPLFPSQEKGLCVPSVQHHIIRHNVWDKTKAALIWSSTRSKWAADQHGVLAAQYHAGRFVWLSSKTIPLKTDCWKLSPRFLGPFQITKIISPSAVRLMLRIHSTSPSSNLFITVNFALQPNNLLPPGSLTIKPLSWFITAQFNNAGS